MLSNMGALKNFANFTGENACVGASFKKVLGPQACNFIKKRLQHRYFPVKFAKFSRALVFYSVKIKPPVAAF